MTIRTSGSERVSAWVVLGAVAMAAVAGLLAGWYQQFTWYDEVVHTAFGFAVTFAVGVWLSARAPFLASGHAGTFMLVLIALGLGIGAAWEMLEFAYDHLTGPGSVILGKFDTVVDLACDLGGAGLAAVIVAVAESRE